MLLVGVVYRFLTEYELAYTLLALHHHAALLRVPCDVVHLLYELFFEIIGGYRCGEKHSARCARRTVERRYGKPRVRRLLVGGVQLHVCAARKSIAADAVRAVRNALRIGVSHKQSYLRRCRVAVVFVGVRHATILGCNFRYTLPSAQLLLAACGTQSGEAQREVGAASLG